MAEDTNIVLKATEPTLGKIEVAPQVLEIVAGLAASDVDGVARMRGSLANSVNELFGKKERGKGVKLSVTGDTLNVDVYAYLNYGVSVPNVALAIQEQVKQQLLFMTDLHVNEVNVHIQGVIPEKTTQAVDPDNLFDDNDNDNNESENGEDK
ncbi:alkaline shock protein [Secundilactobacillus pentosiphilus]|uniref:Alkaline shock protein n=1 Tax=Secundilactobacillus pentosiphilus TaxID=1714682 RepID=A0A1Z5ILU6_9LACO|nr:Asp23/Gls24 family envelope stress response protein [Secundilactobacillus pentosiphilus]GAX02735.1 alkaline shock protein [Secundilactobacillus pentosiphilus]GAX06887.1 alkaline shock protein [Secundilactobacillus pentosiphilus]